MPRFDASTARCEILTFKEGMLSAIAHDLRLVVQRFELEIDDASEAIVARFETDSIRVDCAMKDGRPSPGTLSDKHKREIEANVRRDVLHVPRHPTVELRSTRVEGTGDERRIEGRLRLHGVERPIHTVARRQGDRWTCEVALHQPDFGITPYSAMLGTLRIRPEVRVRLDVPA